jgi:type IV fimbrial biogenesis protein FimT
MKFISSSQACSPLPFRGEALRGYTLIEVLVVIALIAILSGLAAPSFSRLIAQQRGKTIASELFMALTKTRSEALKRNLSVNLSAKAGGWGDGWQILDPGNSTKILEDRGPATGAVVTGPSNPTNVTFTPSGRLPAGSAATFLVTTTAGGATVYQCISVDPGGRPYMKAAQTC